MGERRIRSGDLYDVFEMHGGLRLARNKRGLFIGEEKDAKRLCDELGIEPIARRGGRGKVCSVGRSRKDGKWYGWSHRAIAGFAVGDRVKKGDVVAEHFRPGFVAKTEGDARRLAEAFADDVS